MNITINIVIIYAVIAIISLLLMLGYVLFVRKKDIYLLFIHIAVLEINIGYFLLSISKTLRVALIANWLAYLGTVFLSLCILLLVMNTCKIKYNKLFIGLLYSISIMIFLIAASGGYLDVYYKEVSLKFIDGAAKLLKVYGSLHNLYFVYLFVCFGAMVGIVFYCMRKQEGTSSKVAAFLTTIFMGNVCIWLVEQMITVDFEFLSVYYIITEFLLVFFYSMLEERKKAILVEGIKEDNALVDETVMINEEGICLMEQGQKEKKDTIYEKRIKAEMEALLIKCESVAQLTMRERHVLILILENIPRKDIAVELEVSENTVKKHTSHIFAKLEVKNRKELFEKIGS